ncbi:MAG TPA: carboxypeptidase regulatory-like domain-containing protein [Terriglobia bacterium]|nr:carboxypeptidase regulatory-like domain-containing protein [Terriglobia bacterium]
MTSRIRMNCVLATLLLCLLGGAGFLKAEANSVAVSGTVKDPSGAVIPGATVTIFNPVTGYERTVSTDAQGGFSFPNVPFNPYHMTVSATGFATHVQDVNVDSAVPLNLNIGLELAGGKTTVTVTTEPSDLIENVPTTHTDVDRTLIEDLPLESQSSELSSLVTLSSPGVAADSNGLFHGLGDHASNSFSVDGQPITDQQSKVFSNQLPADAVQSMEVIEGAPPAEYGGKTSLVIVATTRSGLGDTTPHGDATASYGNFGTTTEAFDLGYGGKTWGNFVAANGLNTSRFLDGPEYDVMHDKGNEENVFDRFDLKPTDKDTVNFNFQFTRSWFQTPNSYDAQDSTAWTGLVVDNGGLGPNGLLVGPNDQRSQIKTIDVAPTWTRLLNNETVLTVGGWMRQDRYNYYPSADPFADLIPDLQLQTIGQARRLTNAGLRAEVAYSKGIHNVKAGAFFQHTFLNEDDSFGIVDPTSNAVCLNADGSPYTNPALTNPANCVAPLTPNPSFIPILGCYDLTRTGPLPASDGCTNATSGLYPYDVHTDIKELALFGQDSITYKSWNFNLGLRADFYNGISIARSAEPRLGVAYNIKPSNTILRVSYAHTMETPFNENLILASNGCTDPVINALMTSTVSPCVTTTPLRPGDRNEFHAGLEQAFGKHLVVDGEYIWKYTQRAFDFSVLGDSPITFPIEWDKSKIPGYAIRANVPNTHGFTAYVVMSSVAARFFEPQVAGIGSTPKCSIATGCEVFRIDHDENFDETTHLQYQPFKRGPWVGFNWRYDSGLVAGPVPCAGGNCANGPAGTDSIVDTSIITPDQQFQAGLSCNGVFATPTVGISSSLGYDLCPGNEYKSKYVSIPAPGTENDDHNPPRIAPRNLFDLSVGQDNLFNGDKHKWSLRLTAINLFNTEALYNFISTFSGTHYVTPRALTIELGFHF